MPLPNTWLLDACCALNLAASGEIEAILRTPIEGSLRIFVLEDTVITEAATLRRGGDGKDAEEHVPFDWQIVIDSGLVEQTALQEDEEAAFVSFIRDEGLDDGEAACFAIAAARGWGVVTDDIAARKHAGDVPLLATPDLLHNWAQIGNIEPPVIARALHSIRTRARYGPPRQHPLRAWWLSYSKI